MTNEEVIKIMDQRFEDMSSLIKDINKKVDPLIIEMAKMQGAITMLKWIIGVGFTATAVIIALIELNNK